MILLGYSCVQGLFARRVYQEDRRCRCHSAHDDRCLPSLRPGAIQLSNPISMWIHVARSGDLDRMLTWGSRSSQVDERLNGDGTGKPLGVNDEQLVFAMVGVFTLVWSLWFSSQKDLGELLE